MYYSIQEKNELKLPYLVAALIYNMGKNEVKIDDGNNILNRNDNKHQKYRDEKIYQKLELLPEDMNIIKKTLNEMDNIVIENSRFERYKIIKLIEKYRNETNEDLCNKSWKLVTSSLYDYAEKFTIKDNIFRSRNERTNDEIKQLVNDNIDNYNLEYSEIIKFCLNIEDETNIKLNYILERIFNSSLKPVQVVQKLEWMHVVMMVYGIHLMVKLQEIKIHHRKLHILPT